MGKRGKVKANGQFSGSIRFQVFFPDVERAEWLNRIIKQAWPYANQYLDKAIFREVMIPLIRGASPALADFSFEKLDLGEIVSSVQSDDDEDERLRFVLAASHRWCESLLRQCSRSDYDGRGSFVSR